MSTFHGWHHSSRKWLTHSYHPQGTPLSFVMGETRCSLAGLQLSQPADVAAALHYRKIYGSRLAIFWEGVEVEPLCTGITPVGALGIVQACVDRLEATPSDQTSLETALNTMCYLNTDDLLEHLQLGSAENPLTWHLISAMAMAAQFAASDSVTLAGVVQSLADRSRFDLIRALKVPLPVAIASEGSKTTQWSHLSGDGEVAVMKHFSLDDIVKTGVIHADGLFPRIEILIAGLKHGAVKRWQYDGLVNSEMVYDMHRLSLEDLELLRDGVDGDYGQVAAWLVPLRNVSYNQLAQHMTPVITQLIRHPFIDSGCFPLTLASGPMSSPDDVIDGQGLHYISSFEPPVLAVLVDDTDSDDDQYMIMPQEASVHLWSCDIESLWQQLGADERRSLYQVLDRYSYHHNSSIHQARIDALWQWHQQL